MRTEWRINKAASHVGSERYYVANFCVGTAYRALGSKSEPPQYVAQIFLPGFSLSRNPATYSTQEDAKKRVEKAIAEWFKEALA